MTATLMAPASTSRAHLEARDHRCDTVTVLNMAARKRPGRRYADMNAVAGLTHDWNLHFPDSMGENHFDHIVGADGKIRPCTAAELHANPMQLTYAQMKRYRKRVGRKWATPFTVAERNRQAKRRLVRICWEIKSRIYAERADLAARFVRAIAATGWQSLYMTLVSMWGFGPKLKNFKSAGGSTALLGHDHRLTPSEVTELVQYHGWIDRQWGSFAGGARIADYLKG